MVALLTDAILAALIAVAAVEADLAADEPDRPVVECMHRQIFFAVGSTHIDPQGAQLLDTFAEYALRNMLPSSRYVIEATTDATGSDASNLQLSMRRAEFVRRYLLGRGFPARRLNLRPLGASRVGEDATDYSPDQVRAYNRSATIIEEATPEEWQRANGNIVC